MTVRNLNTVTDYATWALAIAGLPSPLVANTVLEDQGGGTIYSEDVLLVSRLMGGFTLTLRGKSGETKPTIQGTNTANTSTMLAANTIGIIFQDLILSCRSGAVNAACLWVGVEGARGATGAATVTVTNCDFVCDGASLRCIQSEGMGAGNIVTLPATGCTFAGTYLVVCKYTGGGPDDSPVTFTDCRTVGTISGPGSGFWVAAGFCRFTAVRCSLNGGTGFPYSFTNGVNSIIVIVRNCRFFNFGTVATVNGSGGAVLAVATVEANTFVSSGLGVVEWLSTVAEIWAFHDNLLVSTAAAAAGSRLVDVNTANALASLPSNYNAFYLVNTVGNFTGRAVGVDYATLANWQAGTAKDANSISGNPSFVNIGTGDLHVPSGSIVVGAGIADVDVTVDLDNVTRANPPAIGAYEASVNQPFIVFPAQSGTAQRGGGALFTSFTLPFEPLYIETPSTLTLSPARGDIRGGAEFVIRGSALGMDPDEDDFSDGVLGPQWVAVTSGGGTAVEGGDAVKLSSGTGGVGGIRTLYGVGDVDVEMEWVIRKEAVRGSDAVAPCELALTEVGGSGTLVWRVEDRGAGTVQRHARYLVAIINGQTFAFPAGPVAQANRIALRLVRAGTRFWLFANGTLVCSAVGMGMLAYARFQSYVVTGSSSSVSTSLVRYVRRPVVRFGAWAVLDLQRWSGTAIIGRVPASEEAGTVDVTVLSSYRLQTRTGSWTYERRTDTYRQTDGAGSLRIINDDVLKGRN